MAGNTVASPVVTLGLDAGGVKSGVNEALGVMKGAASAIAAISEQLKAKPLELGVNSSQMLSDLAGITDAVESTLKLFERMGKVGEKSFKGVSASIKEASQASKDMIAKMGGTYNPMAAMVRSGGAVQKNGADPFTAGMSKWVQENKPALDAAKWVKDSIQKPSSQSSLDMIAKLSGTYNPMAAMSRSTVAGPRGGPDPFLAGMKAWRDANRVAAKAPMGPGFLTRMGAGLDGALDRSMGFGFGATKAAFGASAGLAGNLFGAPTATLAAISKMSMPVNQLLELSAKATRLLGAPLRAKMASEGGDEDVFAGGSRLLGSTTLSGTLARFEGQVTKTFTDIWDFINQYWDVQGWIESIRGAMEGISILFRSIMDPIKKADKNSLEESFKSGARFVINTFGDVAKTCIKIYNVFADIVNMIQKIPGLGPGKYSEEQENLISDRMLKIRSGWGLLFGGYEKRGMAIAELEKEGKLDKNQRVQEVQKMGEDGINALIKKMLDEVNRLKLNNLENDPNKAKTAALALEDFTRALSGPLDPLANLASTFEVNTKRIEQMQKDGAGVQQVAAAQIANQAAFAQGLADLARGRVEQMRASYQPGAAMDASSMALAEAVIKASNAGQANLGGIEGQQLRALEMIRVESARTREINQRLLEAFQRNPPAPPVWVAPIAGGA